MPINMLEAKALPGKTPPAEALPTKAPSGNLSRKVGIKRSLAVMQANTIPSKAAPTNMSENIKQEGSSSAEKVKMY